MVVHARNVDRPVHGCLHISNAAATCSERAKGGEKGRQKGKVGWSRHGARRLV